MADTRVIGKPCWQCGSHKEYKMATGVKGGGGFAWNCINDCGPESLGNLFRLDNSDCPGKKG